MALAQGDPQGPEFRVNTYTTNLQARPAVAADNSGNFVVVWRSQDQDGSSYGVFGQRYASSGAPLGPEFPVNTYTTSPQDFPSIASDTAGNFVVLWTSFGQDGSDGGVYGQRYANSGAPLGPEFRVNTYTTAYQGFSSVASDAAGNFVVVWQSYDQDGEEEGVFGQRYASSGDPLGSEFRVNTYTSHLQERPAVTSDASGNFVVVWTSAQQDGSFRGIFGQRYDSSGAPLGLEFRVNTYTTGAQRGPDVALDASGSFVVVWGSEAQDGSTYGIFGQRFASSGAPLGSEFRVNTYTTNLQRDPAVTVDASGNFVVVWKSLQDFGNSGVFGQRYDSSGAPLGPEFRVNTYTTSAQDLPSIASDISGNFVVVWHSDTQDGSSFGVFGQRYNQIVPVELMDFGIE